MDLHQAGQYLPLLLSVSLGALGVLYVVIAVKVGRRCEARRQAAPARVAAELGMGSVPEDHALLNQLGGIAFSLPGGLTRATSVMRGTTTRGSPALLFDYHVTFSVGNNTSTLELTVAAFDLASEPLPVFDAEGRQDWSTRLINKALADKVIDFPDDHDFTRYFNVTGGDAQAVRRLLNPDARAFLTRRRAEWTFRSNGRWLVMYRSHKRLKPEDYRSFVEGASEVMLVMTGARV